MALPQVGLEAVIAGLPGFEAGARTITKAYDDIEKKGHNVARASNILGSSISSLSSPFVSIGQSVLNFGAIAGGAALLGVGALTVGIGALGAVALTEVAKFERLELSLKNLVARDMVASGASASMAEAMGAAAVKAEGLTRWIQEVAIQSPFTQDGIQSAFQTAMAYGFTTDQAQRLTNAEVDFAAATGKGIESADLIALALGQIQAKGKVSGQEIIQLTNAGVGVNKILSDMGFTLDDVSNGLVDSDVFIEAVIKDMEIFKGVAKEQSSTFSGLLSSLSDLKGVGLREFFTGTFQAIQPYLADFVDFLTKAALQTGSIREIGNVLGQMVGEGLAKIAGWIRIIAALGAGGGLSILLEFFGPAIFPLWRELSDLVGQISTSFGGMGQSLSGLVPTFAELSAVILPAITTALAFVNDHFVEFQGALTGIGVVLGAGVFAAIVAGILSLVTPITLIVAGAALLGAAWAGNWGGIQEKTFAVWAVVQPILTQMGQWLSVNIPIAIQFLADAWNNVLFPAITAIANWLTGTWFPLQIQWYTFVGTTLVEAITTLSDTWTNTLLPAITAVSDYLGTNVLPLFRAFNDFTGAVFNKTIQAAAGLWQNILWPALQGVWVIINESLQPIFKSLGEMIKENVSPTLNELGGGVLPALAEGLETVTKWIKDATGFFKGLTDAVNNFTLPPVLTPGSPTPFEIALLGIANAADQAGISMENLNNLSLPGMFDKLFKINREITSFKNLIHGAEDGIVSWGKANYIGSEKSENAIKFFKDQWKKHFDEIMAAGNPLEAWTDIVSQREWRLIGLKPDQARKMGSIFFENFFKTADKSANALQNMIIQGSQTALQMANQLNQFGSQQAEYLNSQVETLQAFIKSGEAEMNFEGQIISATQAQELLNQKLADQAAIQDDILQIKQQESKLQFLQSQLDLIKMIKDAGLNVKDVLGNITLGLDASIPDMLAATNNVIQAIINQVDRDLGSIIGIGGAIGGAIVNGVTGSLQIASDSKVMARLGQYTMSGFVNGMMSEVPNLFAGVQQAITGPAIVSAPVLAGAGGQTVYMENNFGGNNISGQMDSAQFDAMVLRSLQRLMG